MILQTTELGLGTCYIAVFLERSLIKLLNLDAEYHLVLITLLGYPDAKPHETGRKPIIELVERI